MSWQRCEFCGDWHEWNDLKEYILCSKNGYKTPVWICGKCYKNEVPKLQEILSTKGDR